MDRNELLEALRTEIQRLTGFPSEPPLDENHLLSQVINSSGFLQLLMAMEAQMGFAVDDEDFYEAAPITVGDLASFLYEQQGNRVEVEVRGAV